MAMSDDNVLYLMQTLSGFEPSDIEDDEFEVAVNDDQFCTFSITDSAKLAADLIASQAETIIKHESEIEQLKGGMLHG